MRQRVIPLLAPETKRRESLDGHHETKARGLAVLNSPMLNKGTAFTAEERTALGLTGLLPPVISTLDAQVKSAYSQYQQLPDALSKNIYLTYHVWRSAVSSRSAASSPSKSSPHGPHACRCAAMPGWRCPAGLPAATSSAYTCSISVAWAHPTSRGSVRRKRSSSEYSFMRSPQCPGSCIR